MTQTILRAECDLTSSLSDNEEGFKYEEIPSTREGTRYFRLRVGSERYFVKQFLRSNGKNGDSKLLRRAVNKDPAGFEYNILKVYKRNGANVPLPISYSLEPNIFIMEDFGDDTLEKRLFGASDKKTEELLSQTIVEMVNLHKVARQYQALFLRQNSFGVLKTSRLVERALNYYEILLLDKEMLLERAKLKLSRKTEFLRLFEVITRDLYSDSQLIHGDMSTYHVFFKQDEGKDKAYFIDLGNPKFAPVVFDIGDLLFSPGIYLPLERKLEISDEYITKDKNVTSRNFLYRAAKDILLNERKRLCFAGIFECLRRTARDREAKVKHPKHFGIFARKHPDYINPAQHYANISKELFDFLIKNSDKYKLNNVEVMDLETLGSLLGEAFIKAINFN